MPVDAIRPPRRKSPAPKKQTRRQERTVAEEQERAEELTGTPDTQKPSGPRVTNREQLVWILAGSVTALIFIIWLAITISTPAQPGESNGIFGRIGNSISDLWDTARTDWLKLEKQLDNSNTNAASSAEEERIQELEEQVFPQFDDPSKH